MKLIRNKLALTPSPDLRTVIMVSEEVQRRLVFDKILEEAHELFNAKRDTDILAELGDLQDAIDYFKELYGIDENKLLEVRLNKKKERGGFDQGYVLL